MLQPDRDSAKVLQHVLGKEELPVSIVRRVDLPTEGNPMSATRACPKRCTSKPSPAAPVLPPGSSSCVRSLASFALSWPKWYSVALFFCVRAISSSISLIFSWIPMLATSSVLRVPLSPSLSHPRRAAPCRGGAVSLRRRCSRPAPCHMLVAARAPAGPAFERARQSPDTPNPDMRRGLAAPLQHTIASRHRRRGHQPAKLQAQAASARPRWPPTLTSAHAYDHKPAGAPR
eukprot:scaffold1142_cov387-Prasinococcus_capsulatus_cf.AAC.4